MQKEQEMVSISPSDYDRFLSLEHQLKELQRLVYGSRSERFISETSESQLGLFGAIQESEKAEESTQTITYDRRSKKEKQSPVRALLPAHLPREEEIIEPEELEEGSKKIGEEVTELLEHTPAKLYVRRIVRPKYASKRKEGVQIGRLPSLPIPKGNAGVSLLALLQVNKFVDHLPFYRQVQIFKREGVKLAESTINGWFNQTCDLLTPLYDCLVTQVKNQDYLQADESPIAVQSNHKKGTTHTGYHWVYHAPDKKLAVFDYQDNRTSRGPTTFLKDFKGTLQTDGYAGYNKIGQREDVTLLACMAHARRYFEKALDNDQDRAEYALQVIQQLYEIERYLRESNLSNDRKQEYRKEHAIPILTSWKAWLEKQQLALTPKSPIGKAVNYTFTLWNRLVKYVNEGNYQIDNNKIENLIRPLALGRKNYLFAGSHQAAQRAAMMYSFFATCKLNEVNPYTWLKNVLEIMPDTKISQLQQLLPNNWSL